MAHSIYATVNNVKHGKRCEYDDYDEDDEKSIEWSGSYKNGLLDGIVVEGYDDRTVRCHFVEGKINGEFTVSYYNNEIICIESQSARVYDNLLYGSWELGKLSYDSITGHFCDGQRLIKRCAKNATFEIEGILRIMNSSIILKN
jgi:hypothetical protein